MREDGRHPRKRVPRTTGASRHWGGTNNGCWVCPANRATVDTTFPEDPPMSSPEAQAPVPHPVRQWHRGGAFRARNIAAWPGPRGVRRGDGESRLPLDLWSCSRRPVVDVDAYRVQYASPRDGPFHVGASLPSGPTLRSSVRWVHETCDDGTDRSLGACRSTAPPHMVGVS